MNPLKFAAKKTLKSFGLRIVRELSDEQRAGEIAETVKKVPDADLYTPTFSPWLGLP